MSSSNLSVLQGVRETSTSSGAYPDAPNFTGPPLFISGCNRGGTTIAAKLICAHPEARNVGRGQFNEGQFIWRQKYPDWSRHRWALPPWCWYLRRTERHANPEVVQFFRREFHAAMEGPGRMVEKTPANAVRLPFINSVYPDCYFVHVVRDGRHTVASLVARKVWLSLAPHQWVRAHRTALADLKRVPEERVLIVRYEELLEDPEETLGMVFRRSGMRWDGPEQEAVLGVARSLLREPEHRWDAFTPAQKRQVLSVIGELQRELGYPVEP